MILFVLVIIAIGLGAYNIAATEKHWDVTEKIIAQVRDSSIAARAKDLTVPPLEDPELLSQGAEHYDAMCTICHLAPGIKATELSTGLYPIPPVFHQREPIPDQTKKLERAKAYFWVIKNGLKMTGMPAWGLSHDDNAIWGMAAFVLKMSNMTPEQYKNLVSSTNDHAHGHEGNDGHGHGHGDSDDHGHSH